MPPIRPADVNARKATVVPEPIIEAFNDLIARAFDGNSARVLQCDVINLAMKKLREAGTPIKREDFFAKDYLEVESLFDAAGWRVVYDRPGFNESYEPSWTFSKRRST